MKAIETIVAALQPPGGLASSLPDPTEGDNSDPESVALRLHVSFLRSLGGELHEANPPAAQFLEHMRSDPRWGAVADFYAKGLVAIDSELNEVRREDPAVLADLDALVKILAMPPERRAPHQLTEAFWTAFFPEGAGIRGLEEPREEELRQRRTVIIESPLAEGLTDPGRHLLLSTNAMLTQPLPNTTGARLADDLVDELSSVAGESQTDWYDHPMPIGVADTANEILHGLRGMDAAIAFEKERGVVDASGVLPIVLSVSVTRRGLAALARRYVEDLFRRTGRPAHLDVYVFTDEDVRRMVDEILAPAASRYFPETAISLLDVLGVDGPYGRHYSFLKAVSAWWHVMVDPAVIATYKFDLDQVFPQEVLVASTGRSALEHLNNPLWGATGRDATGEPVELGMLAGSLVNEGDIDSSLYTADVKYPEVDPKRDELVFWSTLPQALSTAAEMGTQYETGGIDGVQVVLERVHVTGGTTAIRIDALRRHRPFTPSFIGRAEDQAFLLSTYGRAGPRLGHLHADGLKMRHDKEVFAADAVRAAAVAKLVGDYERIILFSGYARAVTNDVEKLKRHLGPFTGCFVSRLPITVTHLRFALRAVRFFEEGQPDEGISFTEIGARRIGEAIQFASGSASLLESRLAHERAGWDLYYDILDALEQALDSGDTFALRLRTRARALLEDIRVRKR